MTLDVALKQQQSRPHPWWYRQFITLTTSPTFFPLINFHYITLNDLILLKTLKYSMLFANWPNLDEK